MSEPTEKKRRKLYLGPDTQFVVARSTRWYSQQSGSSTPPAASTRNAGNAGVSRSPSDSSETPQASPGERSLMDGCSVDASIIRVPTDVLEGSDDAFKSAHGGGDDAHRSSEECCDNEEIHSENDSEDDDTRPFQDADQDPSSGTEGDSGDDLRGDRTSVDQDPSSATEGDSGDDLPGDRTSVPSFDESQLLPRCIADFRRKTLPGSATTIAVAVVLIMSIIAAHGLPGLLWTTC
ncbi:hypothetical protein MTO96_043681 [Rhipicephalus appendiculatus]